MGVEKESLRGFGGVSMQVEQTEDHVGKDCVESLQYINLLYIYIYRSKVESLPTHNLLM